VNLSLVHLVLVRPRQPANVAAACRAMKNMGLKHLRLVSPPEGLERPEARALAYGAWDILDGALRLPGLKEAVADAALVVGTSGRKLTGAWSPFRLASEGSLKAGGGRICIVFGPESSGLSQEELDLCDPIVHIPADPAHPSLNLAQAVLLIAYEIRLWATPAEAVAPDERASAGEVQEAFEGLRRGLLAIEYLHEQSDAVLVELRRLILRAGPTARETTLLRGLARQLEWAGRRIARRREGGP